MTKLKSVIESIKNEEDLSDQGLTAALDKLAQENGLARVCEAFKEECIDILRGEKKAPYTTPEHIKLYSDAIDYLEKASVLLHQVEKL
jgi:hypothetical protein